jgi:RimJ/RimL family protein N-acetyltransferase
MNISFITGNEIYLRPIEPEDADGDYLAWVNAPSIRCYMESLHFPNSRESLKSFIESQNERKDTAFFAIVDSKTDKHIGNAKLGPVDWVNRVAMFGRMIGDPAARGRGIGTEVAKLLIDYGFRELNLHRVTSATLAGNKAAIKSNEKAGMTVEGIHREAKYTDGSYKDLVSMAILKSEWVKASGLK